jgi:hypothetical protein
VPEGRLIRPEKRKTRMVVEFDSINPVTPGMVKQLLQTKYKVTLITATHQIVTCKQP